MELCSAGLREQLLLAWDDCMEMSISFSDTDSYRPFQAMKTGLPGRSYPSSMRRWYLAFVGVSTLLLRASNALAALPVLLVSV